MPLVKKNQRYLSKYCDQVGVAATSDDISQASYYTDGEAMLVVRAMNTFGSTTASGSVDYPGSVVPDKKALELVQSAMMRLEERLSLLKDLELKLSTVQPS